MKLFFSLCILCASAASCVPSPAFGPASRPVTAPVYTAWPFDAREAARRQDETAKALGLPKELALDLGNKVTLKLVLLPAGKFVMGSPLTEPGRRDDEGPQREVTLSRPYYMGVYEVTKGQFAQFIADSGYLADSEDKDKTKAGSFGWNGTDFAVMPEASWRKTGYPQTDAHPVVSVSWNDATAFCKWLSAKTGRAAHLPTEAQWEHACRAGARTAFPWGDNPAGGQGWANAADAASVKVVPKWPGFTWDDGYVFAAPVGQFKPNAFGLYDVIGNAWEWCADWYSRAYPGENQTDPQNPTSRPFRVMRGGGWYFPPADCRCARRGRSVMVNRSDDVGFRVAVDAP